MSSPLDALRAIARILKAAAGWDESEHPREPSGSESGGEFASAGGPGAASGDPQGRLPFHSEDDAARVRLAAEWEAARPRMDALESELADREEPLEIEVSGAPQEWDDVSEDMQTKAFDAWAESSQEDEEQSQRESFAESIGERVSDDIRADKDWHKDKAVEFIEKFPATLGALNIDPDTIRFKNGVLDVAALRDDGGKGDWEWPDDEWDTFIEKAREVEYESRVESEIEDYDPTNDANNALHDRWSEMSSSEKWEYVKDVLSGETTPQIIQVGRPPVFDVLGGTEHYDQTRGLAVAMQRARVAEILKARGLAGEKDRSATGVMLPTDMETATAIERVVWEEWKSSSTRPLSLALQVAAADELGAKHRLGPDDMEIAMSGARRLTSPGEGLARLRRDNPELAVSSATRGEEYDKALIRAQSDVGMERLRAYVRGTWETTQHLMERAGLDHIGVYRAITLPTATIEASGPEIMADIPHPAYGPTTRLPGLRLQRSGAASWTADPSIANGWGGVSSKLAADADREGPAERVVLRAEAPRTAVLSLPVYGQNIHEESEVVLVGTPVRRWDAWRKKAPTIGRQGSPPAIESGVMPIAARKAVVLDLTALDRGRPHWLSAAGNARVEKYDPSQSRDEDGKWSDEGGKWTTLYHGTSSGQRASSIKQRGIRPGRPGSDWVWLTDDPKEAWIYAGQRGAVVQVRVPTDKLGKDDLGGVVHHGAIPSEHVVDVSRKRPAEKRGGPNAAAETAADVKSDLLEEPNWPVVGAPLSLKPRLPSAKFAGALAPGQAAFLHVGKYDPSQPRDEQGQWNETGAGGRLGPYPENWGGGWVAPDGKMIPSRGQEHDDTARAMGKGFKNRADAIAAGYVRVNVIPELGPEGQKTPARLWVDFAGYDENAAELTANLVRDHFHDNENAVVYVDRHGAGVEPITARFDREGPAMLFVRQGVRKLAFKAANHEGAMVALRIPLEAGREIAVEDGEPVEDLHLTLAYLGDAAEIGPEAKQRLYDAIDAVAAVTPPLEGQISGYGRFRENEDGEEVAYASFDAADLPALRHRVVEACEGAGVPLAGDHGFTPHITLGYFPPGGPGDVMPPLVAIRFEFLTLVVAGLEVRMRLKGEDKEPGDEGSQAVLPPETFSELMRPARPFENVADLATWHDHQGGAVGLSPIVGGVGCIAVKKGADVWLAVDGYAEGVEVRADDLVAALARIPHDFIMEGALCARALDGRWLEPDEIGGVLSAEILASPVLMPGDLLAMDGDLSKKSYKDRYELLRAVTGEAGSHVIVPPVAWVGPEGLESGVQGVLTWAPSDGAGLLRYGVRAVLASSPYAHGETDGMAHLVFQTAKGEEHGGGGAPSSPPGVWLPADDRRRGAFLEPRKSAGPRPLVDVRVLAGHVRKDYDESEHPRDDQGQWTESSGGVRVYMRPGDLIQDKYEPTWYVRNPETGKSTGVLLSRPLSRDEIPETLYHATTNMSAVRGSSMLLGRHDGGGLGGGGREGVSLTTSRADAELIAKELRREIVLAKNPPRDTPALRAALEAFAREDEKDGGLSDGSLQGAVDFAVHNAEGANYMAATREWNGESWESSPPRTGDSLELGLASHTHDAFGAYLQLRAREAEQALFPSTTVAQHTDFRFGDKYAPFKNPIILGDAKDFRRLDPANIGVVELSKESIPAEALVREGTDDFLHEVRVHADVPLKGAKFHAQKARPRHGIFSSPEEPRSQTWPVIS